MRCVFGSRATARGPQVTCSAAPYLPEEQEHPASQSLSQPPSQFSSQLSSQPPPKKLSQLPSQPVSQLLQLPSQALASCRRSRALLTPPVIIGACGEKPASSSSGVSFQPLAVESMAMWMSTRPTVLVVRPPCSTAMLGAKPGPTSPRQARPRLRQKLGTLQAANDTSCDLGCRPR